jgi:hypothetical protein
VCYAFSNSGFRVESRLKEYFSVEYRVTLKCSLELYRWILLWLIIFPSYNYRCFLSKQKCLSWFECRGSNSIQLLCLLPHKFFRSGELCVVVSEWQQLILTKVESLLNQLLSHVDLLFFGRRPTLFNYNELALLQCLQLIIRDSHFEFMHLS